MVSGGHLILNLSQFGGTPTNDSTGNSSDETVKEPDETVKESEQEQQKEP